MIFQDNKERMLMFSVPRSCRLSYACVENAVDPRRSCVTRAAGQTAFHGAKDATVAVARSREIVAALRTVNSSVRYTEYPDVGHDLWTRALRGATCPSGCLRSDDADLDNMYFKGARRGVVLPDHVAE